jgi:hypothetical protein
MHEVFHAHDHMRPWATNVELGAAPELLAASPGEGAGATFRRVYGVFRGLAWRLWEGHRSVDEVLHALREEARRSGIDAAWEAALLEYCSRNALGLYSQRESGMAVAMAIKDAVAKNTHPSLATLSRQLDYIELQGRLDARTLADAKAPSSVRCSGARCLRLRPGPPPRLLEPISRRAPIGTASILIALLTHRRYRSIYDKRRNRSP